MRLQEKRHEPGKVNVALSAVSAGRGGKHHLEYASHFLGIAEQHPEYTCSEPMINTECECIWVSSLYVIVTISQTASSWAARQDKRTLFDITQDLVCGVQSTVSPDLQRRIVLWYFAGLRESYTPRWEGGSMGVSVSNSGFAS